MNRFRKRFSPFWGRPGDEKWYITFLIFQHAIIDDDRLAESYIFINNGNCWKIQVVIVRRPGLPLCVHIHAILSIPIERFICPLLISVTLRCDEEKVFFGKLKVVRANTGFQLVDRSRSMGPYCTYEAPAPGGSHPPFDISDTTITPSWMYWIS